jgi:transcription elongation factor GreB
LSPSEDEPEDDFDPDAPDGDEEDEVEAPPPLPAGTKNYLTPDGFKRLQEELHHLRRVERPEVVEIVSWAAGNGDRSENGDYIYGKRRLREIDRRMRFLLKRLEIAEVVDPLRQQGLEQVFFGATVTYVDQHDEKRTVKIVGVDEARTDHGEISWVSPLARALMKKREGDVVAFRAPTGPVEVEILQIAYVTD